VAGILDRVGWYGLDLAGSGAGRVETVMNLQFS
jgi:hypothetical protein